MSGGVSVLLAFYQQIRKKVGDYVLYVVGAMCVFFAGFQAWQDQYDKVADLQGRLNAKPAASIQVTCRRFPLRRWFLSHPTPAPQKPLQPPPIQRISAKQLRDSVISFANNMRKLLQILTKQNSNARFSVNRRCAMHGLKMAATPALLRKIRLGINMPA
jgi:hypothetical protein